MSEKHLWNMGTIPVLVDQGNMIVYCKNLALFQSLQKGFLS